MRRLISLITMIVVGLGTPVWAAAQGVDRPDCLSADQRREALKAIRAGHLDALDKLRSCEADLNQTSGALNELRQQHRREKQQTDKLSAKVGQLTDENATLRQRPKVWQAIALSIGALLVGGAGGYAAGKLLP